MSQDSTTQCDKGEHVWNVAVTQVPDGRIAVTYDGDPEHSGPSGVFEGQRITWLAGDRREYTGEWPGPCTKRPGAPLADGCTLHEGHHGRCAP